jgi:16S rRNA (guanine1207-N2)-methyltransferase
MTAPHLLFGTPPHDLVDLPAGIVQTSPLSPGATLLETIAPRSAISLHIAVPPGPGERRYALAHALRTLKPGGTLMAMGPKDKGGGRIRKELEAFGCAAPELSKKHWRICCVTRPETLTGIDEAIEAGEPRLDPKLDLWTQPGIFSWDKIDEGSQLLIDSLPALSGQGADLGCGLGLLTRFILARDAAVTQIDGIDLDARAIAAARRNVTDPHAIFHWRDARGELPIANLDFVVMNPPFHSGGQDDIGLGRVFLRQARKMLRKGGVLWMVANRHLPYEEELADQFSKVEAVNQSARFKICRAIA